MAIEVSHPVVVVSHGSGINALAIVRSLGRRAIQVHLVAPIGTQNLAAASRFCVGVHWIREETPECLLRTLIALAATFHKRPVIMCDSDEALHLVSSAADAVNDAFIPTCQYKRFHELQDKQYQSAMAVKAGILTPRSWYPQSWSDVAAITATPGRRLIVKPNPSVFTTSAPFKIFEAPDAEAIEQTLRRYVSVPTGMIVQEFVEGDDAQMWAALGYRSARTGLSEILTVSKVRQSGEGAGGVGIVCRTQQVPTLHRATQRFLEAIDYHGPFAIEYKYSTQDREFVFIEANYRTARINVIGRRAGGDVPLMMYASVTGQDIPRSPLRSDDAVWYYDMKGCRERLRRSADPAVSVSLLRHMLLAPWRRTEWAVHSWNDLGPTLRSWANLAREVREKARRRVA